MALNELAGRSFNDLAQVSFATCDVTRVMWCDVMWWGVVEMTCVCVIGDTKCAGVLLN